eukprot:9974213-Heterocapsa_arctica.AAC.1
MKEAEEGYELNPDTSPRENEVSGGYAAGSPQSPNQIRSSKEPYPCVLVSLCNEARAIEFDPSTPLDSSLCPALLGNRTGGFLTAHAYGSAKKMSE